MKKLLSLILTLALTLTAASALANETIVIGATPTPHAEILEFIKDDLAALGYDLDIQIFTEYPIPNPATASGDLDANYFQHIPYLTAYNNSVEDAQKLAAVIPVHYEPYGIYAGTKTALADIAEGDSIAVTNDPSNETRALNLLQEAGLIKLPEDVDLLNDSLTKLDIVENPLNLDIVEVNAELLASTRQDVSFAVINGNFAIGAGLKPAEDALLLEDASGEAGKIYTNYVVVRTADEQAPWVEALRTVLNSDKLRDFILNNEAYAKGVLPVF